jgi:mono/diheme cytochrome c family protein
MKIRFALTAGVLLSALACGTMNSEKALAQDAVAGKEEFRLHCAVCHGMTGLGDGPVGVILKTPAPNLAFIAERNGGKFPFQRIYEIIDGGAVIVAHGTRDMPIWGERYRGEAKPVTPDQASVADLLAQQRILSLVYYIGTLQ